MGLYFTILLFYCIFIQINAVLVNIGDFFQKQISHLKMPDNLSLYWQGNVCLSKKKKKYIYIYFIIYLFLLFFNIKGQIIWHFKRLNDLDTL